MAPHETSRRTLLTLGAAAFAGATAPTLGGAALSPALAAAVPRPRFPGDPGRGRLYFGAALDPDEDIAAFEARAGHLGSQRIFARPDQTAELLAQAGAAVSARRFPILSIKPPSSWRDVATGACNPWLDPILDGLAALDKPLCFTVQHEPENDTEGQHNTAATHRAMTEFVLERAASRAPQVNVIQILMRWTFAAESGRDTLSWISPAPTVFGIDAYNFWEPFSTKSWLSLRKMLLPVIEVVGEDRPLVVGEYATSSDASNPGRGANWMKNALTFALKHNVAAMAYFNVSRRNDSSLVLDDERLAAFRSCVKHGRTIRPQL